MTLEAREAERPAEPGRLAIYYGIPSLINGSNGNIERAARDFARFDVVVFGDGLQFEQAQPGRPSAGPIEHQRTSLIVRRLAALHPSLSVFGYVPLGAGVHLSPAEINDSVGRWSAMGVRGIFFDEAGFDFNVTRERQNDAIDAAHREGLRVFMNAFNPDDLEGSHLEGGDLMLLESFVVRNDVLEEPAAWFERAQRAAAISRRTGIEVWTVTTSEGQEFDRALCTVAWWGNVLWGFNGFGWGEPGYSAEASRMPPRDCSDGGLSRAGAYVSDVTRDGTRFLRRTESGHVEVDFARRLGRAVRDGAFTPRDDRPTPAGRARAAARTSRGVPAERAPA